VKITFWLSFVLSHLMCGSAVADHAPEWLHASRSSAPQVLNLRPGAVSLRQAIVRFGKPRSQQEVAGFPGESQYVWDLADVTVTVTTMYPPEKRSPDREVIYAIEITDIGESHRVLTEHGLRMGSDLRALVQTYGWRYLTGWRPPLNKEAGVVTFIFQDESELSASFTDRGALVRLFVRASNE
jgi:hypothetical protein